MLHQERDCKSQAGHFSPVFFAFPRLMNQKICHNGGQLQETKVKPSFLHVDIVRKQREDLKTLHALIEGFHCGWNAVTPRIRLFCVCLA